MQQIDESVQRLTKDILNAERLSDQEARYLVDAYYIMQEDRKRAFNQDRALGEANEPNLVIKWLADQSTTLEKQIKRALERYTDEHPVGSWMKQITGIGPVISAGLLANISMNPWRCTNPKTSSPSFVRCKAGKPCTESCGHRRTETVGQIWRFAGLDPTAKWKEGQVRPWNAALKTLCWKVGQSFMKFSGKEKCYYGHLYLQRKQYEIARNEAGGNAEAAAAGAARVGKSTDAYAYYSAGKLPPAQIDARARRYAVKQFLSDLHAAWYRIEFGTEPPLPYPIAIQGHAHMRIAPEMSKDPTADDDMVRH